MNSIKFFNIFWRLIIALTIVLVFYVFFRPSTTETIKSGSLKETYLLDDQYDIYFINPSKDSIYITGKVQKIGKGIVVSGKIKSLAKIKLKGTEIEFAFFSENNIRLGREVISIQRDILPKTSFEFSKDGLTIPDDTKEIRIKIIDNQRY